MLYVLTVLLEYSDLKKFAKGETCAPLMGPLLFQFGLGLRKQDIQAKNTDVDISQNKIT